MINHALSNVEMDTRWQQIRGKILPTRLLVIFDSDCYYLPLHISKTFYVVFLVSVICMTIERRQKD